MSRYLCLTRYKGADLRGVVRIRIIRERVVRGFSVDSFLRLAASLSSPSLSRAPSPSLSTIAAVTVPLHESTISRDILYLLYYYTPPPPSPPTFSFSLALSFYVDYSLWYANLLLHHVSLACSHEAAAAAGGGSGGGWIRATAPTDAHGSTVLYRQFQEDRSILWGSGAISLGLPSPRDKIEGDEGWFLSMASCGVSSLRVRFARF